MGCKNGKQYDDNRNNRRRSTIRKILRFQIYSTRSVSYTDSRYQHHEEHEITIRPLSMFDTIPFHNLEIRRFTMDDSDSHYQMITNNNQQISESDFESTILQKSIDIESINENDWKYYIPLTHEKLRTISLLKELVYKIVNEEFIYILNRLLRWEKSIRNEIFFEWFFDELEYALFSYDDDQQYVHPSLLLRSIEQDRYDCTRYLFEYHLLKNKLDINLMNSQGRHCLLMLTHKNGPIDLIQYILTNHFSCLDINKIDLNKFSCLHHSCRHFNLSLSDLLLQYTSKKLLEIENSELHTPLDYWIECLCSLKKLKPTNIQHHSDTLRLDYLLNDADYHSNILFFQKLINHGGQLTKTPLRYIRSILPQLTFQQKLSYVDHHVNLCCTLYKNRLSTLIRDYDNLKITIQAGEILTEFIYALGTVQLEIQNRLTTNIFRNDENLQVHMRMLCFKFFRLFQCIYNNPDINVKNLHFEHIFRRVWIYWKEPVRVFIAQCREKNSTLKSICRTLLFKRLNHYPADIQYLPIHSALKQFIAYDNQFFVVQRKC